MRFRVLILLLLLAVGCAPASPVVTPSSAGLVPKKHQHYIGITYSTLPDGMVSRGAGLVFEYPDSPGDWLLSVVLNGDDLMLWFSSKSRIENGVPVWQLKDLIFIDELIPGDLFVPYGCLQNGTPDFDLVAIVNAADGEYPSRFADNPDIRFAWRTDRENGKIISVSTAGVECWVDDSFRLEK